MNNQGDRRSDSAGENLPLVLVGLYTLVFGSGVVFLFGVAVFGHLEQVGLIGDSTSHRVVSEYDDQQALILSPGANLYQSCIACHGQNGEGNSLLKAPAINRQNKEYMFRQLVKFKEGTRGAHEGDIGGATMRPMAQLLVDEESIRTVIDYVISLSAPLPPVTIEGDIEKGKAAFILCATCHGADGKGNAELKAPSLVGLQDWYIANSLKKLKEGIRAYHPDDAEGLQMRPMSMTIVSEEAMMDIVSYINELSKGSE